MLLLAERFANDHRLTSQHRLHGVIFVTAFQARAPIAHLRADIACGKSHRQPVIANRISSKAIDGRHAWQRFHSPSHLV